MAVFHWLHPWQIVLCLFRPGLSAMIWWFLGFSTVFLPKLLLVLSTRTLLWRYGQIWRIGFLRRMDQDFSNFKSNLQQLHKESFLSQIISLSWMFYGMRLRIIELCLVILMVLASAQSMSSWLNINCKILWCNFWWDSMKHMVKFEDKYFCLILCPQSTKCTLCWFRMKARGLLLIQLGIMLSPLHYQLNQL